MREPSLFFRIVRAGEETALAMPGPAVEIFEVRRTDRECIAMARHVRTPQLFAALGGGRWGIWLAAPGPEPRDAAWIEVDPEAALVIDAAVWHDGPILLGPAGAARAAFLTLEAPRTNTEDFERRAVWPGARTVG